MKCEASPESRYSRNPGRAIQNTFRLGARPSCTARVVNTGTNRASARSNRQKEFAVFLSSRANGAKVNAIRQSLSKFEIPQIRGS